MQLSVGFFRALFDFFMFTVRSARLCFCIVAMFNSTFSVSFADIFQSIAAKSEGEPCCDWVGSEGAGHFVKMVHNGIEYGDMQLIRSVAIILYWHLVKKPEAYPGGKLFKVN